MDSTEEDAEPERRGEGRSSGRRLLYTGARAASGYTPVVLSADSRASPKEEETTVDAKGEAEPEGRCVAVKLCEGACGDRHSLRWGERVFISDVICRKILASEDAAGD